MVASVIARVAFKRSTFGDGRNIQCSSFFVYYLKKCSLTGFCTSDDKNLQFLSYHHERKLLMFKVRVFDINKILFLK